MNSEIGLCRRAFVIAVLRRKTDSTACYVLMCLSQCRSRLKVRFAEGFPATEYCFYVVLSNNTWKLGYCGITQRASAVQSDSTSRSPLPRQPTPYSAIVVFGPIWYHIIMPTKYLLVHRTCRATIPEHDDGLFSQPDGAHNPLYHSPLYFSQPRILIIF